MHAIFLTNQKYRYLLMQVLYALCWIVRNCFKFWLGMQVDWLTPFVTCQSDYFIFGLRHSIENCTIYNLVIRTRLPILNEYTLSIMVKCHTSFDFFRKESFTDWNIRFKDWKQRTCGRMWRFYNLKNSYNQLYILEHRWVFVCVLGEVSDQ